MPGENQRALRGVQQFHGAIEFFLVVIHALPFGRQLGSGGFPVEFAGGLLRILGDVDQHRAGPSLSRNLKGFADGARDVLGARNHHVVLGDRHGDAGDVDFLKRVGTQHLAADLAGDADDRRRIEHRGGDAGDHVRGAGAGRSHGHADSAAGARVAVRHVRGALFVAHQHVMQLRFAQRVVHRQNRAARIAEKRGGRRACVKDSQRISAPVIFIGSSHSSQVARQTAVAVEQQ